jgi:hypothetical protein
VSRVSRVSRVLSSSRCQVRVIVETVAFKSWLGCDGVSIDVVYLKSESLNDSRVIAVGAD